MLCHVTAKRLKPLHHGSFITDNFVGLEVQPGQQA